MNNKERLEKLKSLRVSEDEKKEKFSKLKNMSEWADNVAPLLKYDRGHYETFIQAISTAKMPLSGKSISYYLSIAISTVNQVIIELENNISEAKPTQQTIKKKERANIMNTSSLSAKETWDEIKKDLEISKRAFGKKINFVTDDFKREIIFRDIGHAYVLANLGYSKSAVILAGSVIEELLRLYLIHKKIKPADKTFDSYIQTCEQNGLLKSGISRLTDSVRHFRNIVHLQKEKNSKITISKATGKGAVTSIFTIANDF